ncbi:permease [Sporosarcina sp. OR05]
MIGHRMKNGIGLSAFGILLIVLLFVGIPYIQFEIPKSILLLNTMFLSIILEAFPFILIGVFASAVIQTFVSEDMVRRFIPKNPLLAIVPATIVSVLLPVCECAIILVVRRLLRKGLPLHVGIIFLVGAPILNPIVFASTYYAFQSEPSMAYARMGLAFLLAIIIGLVMYVLFKNTSQLKHSTEDLVTATEQQTELTGKRKWKTVFYHASDEFFDVGKYVIFGTIVASAFQTYFNRDLLVTVSENDIVAPLVMMAFGFVLSICSEADAFIASSFSHTFSTGSLLAFLLYGPMLDLKNAIILFAYFKSKFVVVFMGVITVAVFAIVLVYQSVIL